MARKETITGEVILQTAFEMLMQEGIEGVTARRLAARTGCSTQPIFRIYHNMEELESALFQLAVEYFWMYYEESNRDNDIPFVNLGLAYINFARENNNLFRLLFMAEKRHGKTVYEILDGETQNIQKEIERAREYGCMTPEEIFMKMWIFIHGAATLEMTGDLTVGVEGLTDLLETAFRSFLSRNTNTL